MGDTEIGWTHRPGTRGRSWNPGQGCALKSEGCRNCYAMRMAARFAENGWSKGLINLKTGKWNGSARIAMHKLREPLSWREPSTVFTNSMSDLFYEGFPNEEIAAVFGVMAACPRHVFQVLTKRPDRMCEWFKWVSDTAAVDGGAGAWCINHLDEEHPELLGDRAYLGVPWPPLNVWNGVSVENQEALDERWPHLVATPSAVRFFSAEPLLGPLDFTHVFADAACKTGKLWVIGGCESGPGARPADPQWFHSIAEQCRAAGVPYFHKQMMVDGKLRRDVADFPPGLQIQEWPS